MQPHNATPSFLRLLASNKLCVVLLALSLVLVFAGTLAQTNHGIWYITDKYFRSLWVWIDLGVFIPSRDTDIGVGFPFPGGYTIGALLFVNLLAALMTSIRFTFKHTGMVLTHAGLMVLISGEFVTGLAADEGNMTIGEGAASNFVEDTREVEFVFVEPVDAGHDRMVVVPQSILAGADGTISDPRLPFEIRVDRWMGNSEVLRDAPPPPGLTQDELRGFAGIASAGEIDMISGVGEQRVNAPSAYVTLLQGGSEIGTWLVSVYFDTLQSVELADNNTRIALRFKRTYKPYTIHLVDFSHDRFIGTDRPRNFSSRVRLVDPDNNEDREVLIYMNHPLRHGGDTLYQASYLQGDSGTVLQVVRNPGWLIPYVSCIMVSLGLGVHFVVRLVGTSRGISR